MEKDGAVSNGVTTVLVVEDNDGDAFLVEEALQRWPAEVAVHRALRLADAFEIAGDVAIDAVLLDLSLPDSAGLETVTRAVAGLSDVPIVVLTGTDDAGLAEQAVHVGAQDYLVKGCFDSDTLVRVVRYARERHVTTRLLRQRNEELAQANRFKDDFIAIASHELRTPVTVISGAVQTVREHGAALNEDDRRSLMMALGNQSDRLVALVEDLLVLARVDRGALQPAVVPSDLRACVAEAVQLSSIAEGDVEVDVPAATALTDPDYLARVLVNLLDNAHKYGAAPVVVAAVVTADWFEVRVRDHGAGVDPELRPRLFERFARSDAPEVRRQTGTGLGLAIVSAITRSLGGAVRHEDAPGGGACFVVRVPTGPEASNDDTQRLIGSLVEVAP